MRHSGEVNSEDGNREKVRILKRVEWPIRYILDPAMVVGNPVGDLADDRRESLKNRWNPVGRTDSSILSGIQVYGRPGWRVDAGWFAVERTSIRNSRKCAKTPRREARPHDLYVFVPSRESIMHPDVV